MGRGKLFKLNSFLYYMPKKSGNKAKNKEKSQKQTPISSILLRYLILILLIIPIIPLGKYLASIWELIAVNLIFTPLTAYPVYFLLKLFFDVIFFSEMILLVENILPIELIPACIAGYAYYLLLVLNLSTPNLKAKTRIYGILFSFAALLLLNVLRIFGLSFLAMSDFVYFDVTHQLFWYLVSTLFVVVIWFAEVKIFKIKDIPFYSDIKYLFEKSSLKPKK